MGGSGAFRTDPWGPSAQSIQDAEKWADAQFAEDYISKETALAIRQHLRNKDEGNRLFFCATSNKMV
jgi:hypothetical protein